MTTPTDDQLAAAAQKARADHETAREIAARLLAPPDPVDILAGVISPPPSSGGPVEASCR